MDKITVEENSKFDLQQCKTYFTPRSRLCSRVKTFNMSSDYLISKSDITIYSTYAAVITEKHVVGIIFQINKLLDLTQNQKL